MSETHRTIRTGLILAFCLASLPLPCLLTNASAASKGIRHSKHDMSVTGPGPTKAAGEREICIFCHAPHGGSAEAPLWNRYSSGQTYKTYDSSTAKAKIGQPTGSSKLCLSCHDGTVALGMVRSRSRPIRFAGRVTTMPEGPANLTTDLSDDHPISFHYDRDLLEASGGRLKNPEVLDEGPVRLDSGGQVQCTTCHDPHDNRFGKFMVMDNKGSLLCLTCHNVEYWDGSIHKESSSRWTGKGANPWQRSKNDNVKDNGCGNCHATHTAGIEQRLLDADTEEDVCLKCHNGNVASKNIAADFEKASRHKIEDYDGVHDPTEEVIVAKRHVECFDCHNGHAVRNIPATAPTASGALLGVPGVNIDGAVVKTITKQYELCFRCHSESDDKVPALVPRVEAENNVRKEFDPSNASFHPVAAQGKNPNVPSLDGAYNPSSWLYCTDCHSSNTGRNAGGKGANGPHGSAFEPILERRMEFKDDFSENAATYALCYKCHNRDSILGDQSFTEHKLHVVDVKASCTTCHDPHGVKGNTHLINFNIDYVKQNSAGELKWEDLGDMSGKCYLTCHGKDHAPLEYPEPLGGLNEKE